MYIYIYVYTYIFIYTHIKYHVYGKKQSYSSQHHPHQILATPSRHAHQEQLAALPEFLLFFLQFRHADHLHSTRPHSQSEDDLGVGPPKTETQIVTHRQRHRHRQRHKRTHTHVHIFMHVHTHTHTPILQKDVILQN